MQRCSNPTALPLLQAHQTGMRGAPFLHRDLKHTSHGWNYTCIWWCLIGIPKYIYIYYIYIYCITSHHDIICTSPHTRGVWFGTECPQCRLFPRIPCLTAGQSAALSLSAVIHGGYGQRSAGFLGPKIGPKVGPRVYGNGPSKFRYDVSQVLKTRDRWPNFGKFEVGQFDFELIPFRKQF